MRMRMRTRKDIPNEVLLPEIGHLLDEGKEVIITAKGNSMLPFIRSDRDKVRLVKRVEVKRGDIVLAKTLTDSFVLHRVIDSEGDILKLMGDGNIRGTEKCRREDVLGTVAAIIGPAGGEKIPGNGRCWMMLKPFRRYILGIYRRLLFIR